MALELVEEWAVVKKQERRYTKKVGESQNTEDKMREYDGANIPWE